MFIGTMFIGKQAVANGIYQCHVIDNIMNHVYWQTILDYEPRVVFTNAIDNIMNHVYWQTRACLLEK